MKRPTPMPEEPKKGIEYLKSRDRRLGVVIDQGGSVASLYFWMVAGGAIPGLTDPAPKQA